MSLKIRYDIWIPNIRFGFGIYGLDPIEMFWMSYIRFGSHRNVLDHIYIRF